MLSPSARRFVRPLSVMIWLGGLVFTTLPAASKAADTVTPTTPAPPKAADAATAETPAAPKGPEAATATRPAAAKAPEAATAALSGPTRFLVSDCNSLSLTLRFTANAKPLAVRTKNPTPASSTAAVGWGIEWETPKDSDAGIKEFSSAGTIKSSDGSSKNNCPEIGSYTVPLTVSLEGDPATTVALTIGLVRTADPTLDAPSAVTLPVGIWPLQEWLHPTSVTVQPIAIRESSTKAPIPDVSASGAELKNAAGESEGIALVPDTAPVRLDAGQGGHVGLTLSRTPAPGTYTSRIVVRAKSLPDKPIDVTLKVRIFPFFLLLMIAIGVVLGWVVNVNLAARSAIDAARLAALRAAGAIGARAGVQKDPAVQQRLLGVAQGLEAKLRTESTADALQADVTTAQHAADAIETQAASAATSFAQSLNRVRAVFQPDGQALDDMVAMRLEPLARKFSGIERAGEAGDIEQATHRLDDFERSLLPGIILALRPWLDAVRVALDDVGVWADPAQEPEQTRLALIHAMVEAYKSATASDAVKLCFGLARDLRVWAIVLAPPAVATTFHAAAAVLRAGGKVGEAAQLDSIAVDSAHPDGGAADPLARLRALAVIRRRAEALLRGVTPNNPALDTDLMHGDFLAAARRLAPPPALPAGAQAVAMVSPAPLQRQQTAIVAPQPGLAPRLILPAQLVVGHAANVSVDWAGTPEPDGPLTWRCDPADVVRFRDTSVNAATVIARQAGFVTITAALTGVTTISASTYAGEPTATADYQQIARDAGRIGLWTGAATALVTTFAGYIIFSGTWFGTLSDVFSVFAWGFFGQFGLDRIRQLATPITSKTL